MAKLNGDNQKPFNCFKNGFRLRSRLVYGTAMKFISGINFFIFSIECLNGGKLEEPNVAANANSTLHRFVIVGESFAAPYKNGTIRNVCAAMCKAETEYGLRRNCTLRCKILFILLLYILRSKHNSLSGSMLVAKERYYSPWRPVYAEVDKACSINPLNLLKAIFFYCNVINLLPYYERPLGKCSNLKKFLVLSHLEILFNYQSK